MDAELFPRASMQSNPTSRRSKPKPPIPLTGRTTARKPAFRIRPTWHKWIGAGLLVAGVALLVLNDLMMLQPSLLLLPGGHSELYLIAAVLVAGYSTWFFGWFDRTR